MDIFDRISANLGPLGSQAHYAHGYFAFPKLEGPIQPRMMFQGNEVLTWSLDNYLGLANHPEVWQASTDGAAEYGMGYPMGARIMSGNSTLHEQLENELADVVPEAGLSHAATPSPLRTLAYHQLAWGDCLGRSLR